MVHDNDDDDVAGCIHGMVLLLLLMECWSDGMFGSSTPRLKFGQANFAAKFASVRVC